MSFLFGLCSPSGVQSQVVPRKYTISSDGDQFDNSPKRKVDVIRLKPQPTSSSDASHLSSKISTLSIDEELYLFALDVKLSSSTQFSVDWLGGTIEALSAYTFDQNNTKSVVSLICLLRNVVVRYKNIHYDGFMAPSPDFSKSFICDARFGSQQLLEPIPSISSACKTLSTLLNGYLTNGQSDKRISRSVGASSPRNFGNSFHTSQNVLKIADIFLMAMLENTTNMCSLDDSVFFDIIKLCRLLVAYYLTVPPGAAHSDQGETASIFTQILCKCCHLVSTLYQYAENVFLVTPGASAGAAAGASAIAVNVHTALEDATQLVQIVSEGIMFLNAQLSQSSAGGAVHASTTEGNLQFRAYYASMLFWQTCTELLHLLQRIEHTSCLASAKQVNATAGTSSGHTAAPHEARWRTLQCRIFNVFYATAPSAEQIQSELHRLQVYRLDSHLFSADQFCMKFLLPSYGVPKTTYREDINVVTVRSDLSAALAYGISSGQADASSPRQQQGQVHLPQTSFRMRFLFYGINTLFDAAVSLNSPTQMLLTATPAGVLVQAPASIASPGEISAKWAVALAEILFNILSEARAGNCGSLLYAPYFAQQILLILRKLPAPQSKGTNWIYWDLAKSLGEFTNLLRRQLRALDSRNQLARHSSYSQNTVNGGGGGGGGPPSVASLKISHTEPTVALSSKTRSGGASGGTGSSKVDRPLGALRNTSSGSSSKQAPAAPHLLLPTGDHTTNTSVGVSKTEKNAEGPAKPLYSVGDKVDGQCVLQNGSKRWYPGEVVQVITSEDGRSFAYKLRYMDGEERSDQAERDIRVPKKRKARGTSGNGNRTEDEDSGYESGKFAHRMSTDSMDSVDAEAWMDRHALKVGLGHAQHGAASDARTRADSAGSGSVEFPHNPALHPTSARSGAPRAGSFRTAEELKGTNAVLYRLQGQERPNSGAHMGGIGMPRLSINSVTSMKSVEEEGCRLRTISAEHEAEVEVETQAGAAVGAQVVEAVAVTVTDFSDDGAEAGDEAGSDGGDDEEDRVFEIPSVFEGGHRTMPPASINGSGGSKMFKEGLVPRIQFGDLDMSSGGLPHSFSNMSLSGALLSESSIMRMSGNSIGANGPNSFRANGNNGDGTSRSYKAGMVSQMTSHRSYQDASLQSVSGEEHNAPFSHALMAPHALQNFDRAIGSHRNAHDPNFPDEPSTGGNTRMLTWRAAEDACTHFTVSTTAANGRMMPTTQPSSAYLAAQERVFRKSSFHGPSSSRGACTDSSIPEVPVQFKQYLGLGVGLEDSTVSTLLQTYHIIVAILLQRAVSTSSDPNNSAVANSPTPGPGAPLHCAPAWLDSAVCSSCNEFPSPFRGAPVDCSTNILFNVREYLEILPSSSAESHNHNMSMFGSYATATASTLNVSPESSLDLLGPAKAVVGADVAHTDKIHENIMLLGLHRGDAARRLCKMISGAYLKHSCLVQHMLEKSSIGVRLAEKIGEGGFGTVFKVTCNCCSSVGAYMQYSNCYGCHRRTHLFKNLSPDLSSRNITSCCCWKANNHTAYSQSTTKTSPAYAIKRVPRERSMHDPSRLFDLYQEISALEILRDRRTIGVCGIEDYGVVGSEYWLVMELGVQNLEEWRNYLTAGSPRHDASVASPAESTSRALTMQQVASCLLLYIDALYILESVHAADIAHFDLKSSNFVLRPANRESFTAATLSLSEMCQFHQSGLPSGAIFLADFGEAIPHISSAQGSALVRTRCRGTLHTQSPEMLCISATGASSAPPHTCPSSSNSTVNIGMPSGGNCLTAPRAPTPTPTPVPAPVAATRSSKNPRKVLPLPDCRSDLWSMGCLLVELLAGCPLFQDKPWPELYITLCMETFTSLESLIPAVLTPALARIPLAVQSAIKQLILAVLQQLPSDRPTTKSLIVQAGAVLQSHFREYLEVHAEVGPRLSNNSFDSKKETVPEISLSGVHAQVVTLTSVDVATPPIPCGSDVHFRFIRCTPRLTNVFSAGNVNSQLNDSVTAGAAQPICRIDGDILLASLGQCAHAMAMQETGRSPNQQVITLRVRSQTLQQDGLSARLPVADNLVFDLLVNPAAQMSHLLSEVTRAVQRVHTARTEAGKSAVAAGQITVAVVVEVEPQLPVPLASEDAPALWETDKLAVSVAVAAASLLNRSTPSSGGDNSNAGAECALQKVINLWRSLPRLQSYCDQEVVRRLICASAVSR